MEFNFGRAMSLPSLTFAVCLSGMPTACAAQSVGSVEHSLGVPAAAASRGTVRDITLRDAVGFTLQFNPELAAFEKELRALDGASVQAGVFKNPLLGLEGDEIGGNGRRTTTIRVSQFIELGGKRTARMAAASATRRRADDEFLAKRADILTRLAQAFIDVLAAQQRTTMTENNFNLATQFSDAVSKRVQAGKVSPVEATKATVGYASARIELEQARRDFTIAKKQLASFWTSAEPQFSQAVGDLDTLVTLPSLDALTERLRANPLLLQREKSISERQALVAFEKSRRTPDVIVSAGVKRIEQTQDNTLVLSVAIPIPLFDRNQGNLQEAFQRLAKAEDEKQVVALGLSSALVQTHEALRTAESQIRLLRADILPAAQSAFDAANKGYELGKFGFLDVLDAQRTLFQNRALYLRALVDYQRLVAELERIIAGPLELASVNGK